MNQLDPIRALRIIEGLALTLYENDPEDKLAKDLYMIAHQAAKPSCANNHPDFKERALEIEEDLVDGRTISPWNKI
jgi:hypothetical protein